MIKDKLIPLIEIYIKEYKLKDIIDIEDNYKVEFLAQGEYNVNFKLYDNNKKYVFRVNIDSQLDIKNQIKYEYDALKALEISKVTPKVYFVDDSKKFFNYGILIMEFLNGNPLEYSKDISKAAEIFKKIHSLDLSKVNTSSFIVETNILKHRVEEGTKLLKNIWDSDLINKNTKNALFNLMSYCEKNIYKERFFIDNKYYVINNTEVNSHNFIIGDKHYLIDWEKPVISDPCQDITQFLAKTTTLWKQDYILKDYEIKEFYSTYKQGVLYDINIEDRVNIYAPYLYLRALSWCANAYLDYQNPEKAIKNMDTYNKIKSYLEVDFLNKLLNEYK